MIAEATTNGVILVFNAQVTAKAVGGAEFPAVVFIVKGGFEALADFVRGDESGCTGFVVGVEWCG